MFILAKYFFSLVSFCSILQFNCLWNHSEWFVRDSFPWIFDSLRRGNWNCIAIYVNEQVGWPFGVQKLPAAHSDRSVNHAKWNMHHKIILWHLNETKKYILYISRRLNTASRMKKCITLPRQWIGIGEVSTITIVLCQCRNAFITRI